MVSGVPLWGENIDLSTALKRAKENSLELSSALFQLGMDEARHRLAWRLYLPAVSLTYAQNDSVTYYGPDSRSRRIGVSLEQTVYDRGKRSQNIRSKERSLRLQQKLFAVQEETLLLKVVTLYQEALAYRLRKEIMESTLSIAREQARIGEQELRLGEITEADYLSILAQVKDLELEQSSLRREESRVLFEFGKLIGRKEKEEIVLIGRIDPEYRGFVEREKESVFLSEARKNSTELEQLRIELSSLRDTLRREETAYLPEVSARMELSMGGTEFPLTEPGFTIGVTFGWSTPVIPLSIGLSGGKEGLDQRSRGLNSQAGIAENLEGILSAEIARAELNRAQKEYETSLQDLEFEVKESLSDISESAAALQILKDKEKILERKQKILSLKVQMGEITRLTYVEGEIDLAKNRMEVLAAVTELFQRETSLLTLCGMKQFGTYPTPLIFPPLKGGDSP
jgi:outer membrane protein TolC